jgi:hypothetical protein
VATALNVMRSVVLKVLMKDLDAASGNFLVVAAVLGGSPSWNREAAGDGGHYRSASSSCHAALVVRRRDVYAVRSSTAQS